MSHWNHRVCKETLEPTGVTQMSGRPLVEYTIREAYYNNDGELCAVTENNPPIGVYATNEYFPPEVPEPSEEEIMNELRETVKRFEKALSKPIVDLDTIVWADWDKNMDGDERDWDEDED